MIEIKGFVTVAVQILTIQFQKNIGMKERLS